MGSSGFNEIVQGFWQGASRRQFYPDISADVGF